MTTVVTRQYPDTATAQAAVHDLTANNHSMSYIRVITRDGDGAVADRMRAAPVNATSTAAYAPHVEKGAALLVVNAPFNPIGAARDAMDILDRHPPLNAGVADENDDIRAYPTAMIDGRVMHGTVFFMSIPLRPTAHGHILGSNPIIPSKPRTSAIAGGAYISTKFWPMKCCQHRKRAHPPSAVGSLFHRCSESPRWSANGHRAR